MLRGDGPHVGTTDRKPLLLEGMLLRYASLLLVAWGKMGIRTLLSPGHRLLIDGFHGGGLPKEVLILRIFLFELMDIA
jgi:hypothetical protein